MRLWFNIILLILFSNIAYSDVIITEVMSNTYEDKYNEWAELLNSGDEAVDLGDWSIGDDQETDIILGGLYDGKGTILLPQNYAIITDEATRVYDNFDVNPNALRLYVDDSSLGGYGLSNNGEILYLYDGDNQLIDKVAFPKIEKNHSYALFNNQWYGSVPSPGYENSADRITDDNYKCDWSVDVMTDKVFFGFEEEFDFKVVVNKIRGNKANVTILRNIIDIYGNIEKNYTTLYSEITYRKTLTYSPNLKSGIYFINATIKPECEDTSLGNNNYITEVVILEEVPENESFLEIERVYDLGSNDKAEFGQIIRVKVNAYKGGTNKESIKLYVSDGDDRISKETKTSLEDKFTEYSLTLPIQLKHNCDEKLDDGHYKIFLEGLDQEDSYDIRVSGRDDSLCEKEKKETTKTGKLSFDLVSFERIIQPGDEFETKIRFKNEDNKDYNVDLYSYVYRGSKAYSGDRDQNKETFSIKAGETKTLGLENIVQEAEPGDYKFKIKIKRDDRKTEDEITKDITVIADGGVSKCEAIVEKGSALETGKGGADVKTEQQESAVFENVIVYESQSFKAKNMIPYFIIALLFFLFIMKSISQ